MSRARDWLSHSAERLRRLGRFLFPDPPEWGWAPPVQDQRDRSGPGWSLANSVMVALMAALLLVQASSGWRIFIEVMLVVAVCQAVFFAVRMARRHWRGRSAHDLGRGEAESDNPE
jgi:hypothetical protein